MKWLRKKMARKSNSEGVASEQTLSKTIIVLGLLLAVVMVSVSLPGFALAGTADTEFQALNQKVNDWTQGFLGKSIAVAGVLVGAGVAIYERTVGGVVTGLVIALALAFLPGAIAGLVTATL